jgi:uncharacterized protein
MAHDNFHEQPELLSAETRDMHRAIVSLIEELEAIDWYQQRAEACTDAELREVLVHNKNEEIEHALMTLEWIRRRDPVFDANARTYLFSESRLVALESHESHESHENHERSSSGCLGIGSLKG